MKKIGKALLVDFYECEKEILNDLRRLKFILEKASVIAGATPLRFFHWEFFPQGITAGWILAESHIIIHTFPEKKLVSLDFYTCGKKADPRRSLSFLVKELFSKKFFFQEVERPLKGPLPQT